MRVPDPPQQGFVYFVDLDKVGRKPFVVVSNNARNMHLDSVLAVRLTTTPSKRAYPTHVRLGEHECVTGTVRYDDLITLYRDEFRQYAGALTVTAMQKIDKALKHALAL